MGNSICNEKPSSKPEYKVEKSISYSYKSDFLLRNEEKDFEPIDLRRVRFATIKKVSSASKFGIWFNSDYFF